ncbi:MAG: hypothetical protein BWK73_09345 [Thiothrix lacustris]|uniref:Uncharacterized protein n=1 Tax=Thiothrix lacustris TaxID=525917 RepID=A0A1Y1QVN4_9GAMM|nr:MAG: hypothetical protein BWK73_09345 [Thiothrix lacustris]
MEIFGVTKDGTHHPLDIETLHPEIKIKLEAKFLIRRCVGNYLGHWMFDRDEHDDAEFDATVGEFSDEIIQELYDKINAHHAKNYQRLLALASAHCPNDHPDFEEIN